MDISQIYFTTALFLGALHTFEPGHGKAIMAAYLVGSGRRVLDAILLGLVIAFTHTFSVIGLGLLMKVASETFLKNIAASAIEIMAALMIIAVGVWILYSRRPSKAHHHHHANSHNHNHDIAHTETGGQAPKNLWQLLLLGISGGLVPCPAGIAILLAAVASGQLGRGLSLVLFFSLGVAVTIVTIGIIVCKLTDIAEHFFFSEARWTKWIPFISGVFISLLGCGTVIRVLVKL